MRRRACEAYVGSDCHEILQISKIVTNTLIWRIPPHFASSGVSEKAFFLYLFLEMPHLSREIPIAEHLAWHDSLANYASSTTFRHILLSLCHFSLHSKALKRVKIPLCTTEIASQKRQMMLLVTKMTLLPRIFWHTCLVLKNKLDHTLGKSQVLRIKDVKR